MVTDYIVGAPMKMAADAVDADGGRADAENSQLAREAVTKFIEKLPKTRKASPWIDTVLNDAAGSPQPE
jgi:hypothetical protein